MVFSQCNFWLSRKKLRKSHKFSGRGGKEIFFTPHISPNFGFRELKIYMRLELSETHLHSEFCDPNHKNGAWGTIVEIKNFSCSGGCRFRIKMPVPGVKGP